LILIITNKSDIHCNSVINKLTSWRKPFFRLNTESLLTDYDVEYSSNNKIQSYKIYNKLNNKIIDLNDVTSVWERRPLKPDCSLIADAKIKETVFEELDELRWWIRSYVQTKRFLGHCSKDRLNENKILQLNRANSIIKTKQSSNIIVPETILSAQKEPIKDFLHNFDVNQRFCIKPLAADGVIVDKNYEMVFWSRVASKSELEELLETGNLYCPSIIQPYIDKKFEVRTTVVGNEILSCKIDSQALKTGHGKEDWRQSFDNNDIGIDIFNLPPSIEEFVLEYNNRSGSNFGCFDFIVTPDEKFYFLECNPNGQWLWLEEACKIPISKSIAEYLAAKNEQPQN
jgi:hypothetical protein